LNIKPSTGSFRMTSPRALATRRGKAASGNQEKRTKKKAGEEAMGKNQ